MIGASADLEKARRRRDEGCRAREAAGARRLGYKIGLTSPDARRIWSAEEREFGVVFDDHRYHSGDRLSLASFYAPQLEPEIAVVLKRDLAGPALDRTEVLAAVGGVRPAFEIIDSRSGSWDLTLDALIADDVVACGMVLGDKVAPPADFAGIVFTMDPQFAGDASGRALMSLLDDPLDSLAWLARTLGERRSVLRAGETVLTGSCCRPIPLSLAVGTVEASFSDVGAVRCTIGP